MEFYTYQQYEESAAALREKLGGFRPRVLLVLGLAVPIYIFNSIFDTNFMFLMEPDSGNPLEMFEKLLGSHLWGFPILLPVVILAMYLPARIFKRK